MGILNFFKKERKEEKEEKEDISTKPQDTTNTSDDLSKALTQEVVILAEETKKTPIVSYNPNKKQLSFVGRSIPEDSNLFWEPIHDKVMDLVNAENQGIVKITFQLEYFNTASAKHILDIFKKDLGGNLDGLSIDRRYEQEDEDMLEAGEDYQEIMEKSYGFQSRTNKILPNK